MGSMKLYGVTLTALLVAVATLSTDSLKHYVNLTFSNTKGVSRIDYTLTYYSNGKQKGFAGGFKNGKFTSRSVRKQILGTCSSGKCVFHASPKNFQLDVTYYNASGKRTTETKTLP